MKKKTFTNYREPDRVELFRQKNQREKEPTGIFVDRFGGWEWYDSNGVYWHTDQEGNGLWRNEHQEIGTCQFSLSVNRKKALQELRNSGYDVV